MRKIKFRGVAVDTKQKVYGDLIQYASSTYIQTQEKFVNPTFEGNWANAKTMWTEVISESVGQFTELKDKNNNEIYEKDKFQDENNNINEVIFNKGCFQIGNKLLNKWNTNGKIINNEVNKNV